MKRYLLVFALLLSSYFIIAQNPYDLDVQLGNSYAPIVEQQMGIYDEPEATAYVRELGYRLTNGIKGIPFKFRFNIIDSPEPNAFAIPGGHIYVTRGILCVANNEQELAGVIGHEIIHVLERHTVEQLKKSMTPSLLQLPGLLVGKVSPGLGALINAPIGLGSKLFMASYGRGQEKEADKLGISLAGRAGYDPQQLAVILTNLSTEVEALTGKAEKKNYFADHPFTPKRADYINKTSEKVDWSPKEPIASGGRDFLMKFDGMYFGYNPAQGVFQGQNFLHPDLRFFIQFPKDWTTENSPSAVGAAQDEGNGVVYLTIPDTTASPQVLGGIIENKLREGGVSPTRSEPVTINGNSGYVVTAQETTKQGTMNLDIVFVDLNGIVYQIIGLASDAFKSDVELSWNSLRSITNEERNSIKGVVLHVVAAEEGESIEEFSRRTGNEWKPSFTAVMNNIPEDRLLEGGQYLKIVKSERYSSN